MPWRTQLSFYVNGKAVKVQDGMSGGFFLSTGPVSN